jgi:hypothetical protein
MARWPLVSALTLRFRQALFFRASFTLAVVAAWCGRFARTASGRLRVPERQSLYKRRSRQRMAASRIVAYVSGGAVTSGEQQARAGLV